MARPLSTRKFLIEILRWEGSYDHPVPRKVLQSRLNLTQMGVAQAIYRARHVGGAPIKFKGSCVAGEGYYLDEK